MNHQRSIEEENPRKQGTRGGGGAKKRSKKVGEKRPKRQTPTREEAAEEG